MPGVNPNSADNEHTPTLDQHTAAAADDSVPNWVRTLMASLETQHAVTQRLFEALLEHQTPQLFRRSSQALHASRHANPSLTASNRARSDFFTSPNSLAGNARLEERFPQMLVQEPRSLEPEEIAIFANDGDDVEFFCLRIKDMAIVNGQAAVCEVLPRCLRSRALNWYASLGDNDYAQLRRSTDAWIRLLRERFGMSMFEAHSELIRLRYDVNSNYDAYHERKIRLARVVGLNDPKLIVQYIFDGLPFEMRNALASSLEGPEAGDLNLFRRRCLAQRATTERGEKQHWF